MDLPSVVPSSTPWLHLIDSQRVCTRLIVPFYIFVFAFLAMLFSQCLFFYSVVREVSAAGFFVCVYLSKNSATAWTILMLQFVVSGNMLSNLDTQLDKSFNSRQRT